MCQVSHTSVSLSSVLVSFFLSIALVVFSRLVRYTQELEGRCFVINAVCLTGCRSFA